MKLKIKVFPKSSREEIIEKDGIIKVYVKAVPEKGKANKAVINAVAKKYKVKKCCVTIISGLSGRNKIVEVVS
ncbi:MAG: DUF167 domain-containing protein [Candidatus Omnitrophota bacterium]